MNFAELLRTIIANARAPITPQEIHEIIKRSHPEFYGTDSQLKNVEKGNYTSLDHALLANIYTAVRTDRRLRRDTSTRPMRISLLADGGAAPREESVRRGEAPRRRARPGQGLPEKVRDLLENLGPYHVAYYEAEVFGGPSLYFHRRALETRQTPCSTSHLEYVYATLASWGMHRMGGKGSKMRPFERFLRSVEALVARIHEAQQFDLTQMDETRWGAVREIFEGIDVMASRTRLVGNSKVMHHLIPNLVPPIDREYTLAHLLGSKNITNDLHGQWDLMRGLIEKFFVPVISSQEFSSATEHWARRSEEFPWDTSPLKIVDNLIIGAVKARKPAHA
ncbi:MAG: hypothetical protein FDZ69_04625 [Deltaproteobacteria bacterium]|nr:MAG: hypothetical protein FDZ69_04625 [Deltaproteobacteria bacterium]